MYKVIDTTDDKFEGIEIESIPSVGEKFKINEVEFEIQSITVDGDIITIGCSNYIAVVQKVD